MPGSGKGIIALAARKLGLPVISMGDIVREEALRRGLPLNRRSLSSLAAEIRACEGPEAIARRCFSKINSELSTTILIDGLRSPFEYWAFRERYQEMILIFVFASPGVRYARLRLRGREDDPQTWDEFVKRDRLELNFGISVLFYLSDIIFINENKSFEEALKEALQLLRRLTSHGNKSGCRGGG